MKFRLRHQSEGKIYPYIVPTGHLMYRGVFKKVYIHNKKQAPTDRPVLLAVNHPTAFLECFLLCTYLDGPVYNMTRGDMFNKPFIRRFLQSINMFPVFRVRDGYTDQDRNDETFDFVGKKLFQKRIVAIYVEGSHQLTKHVRPAQKGIARIAFAAYEKYGIEDLEIIPTGCNFVYGDRTRDVAMINVGQPLYVRDYWADYQAEPAKTILRLCRDIEEALKKICYHLHDPADETLAERLLVLHRSEHTEPLMPFVTYNNRRFLGEKSVCDFVNMLSDAEKAQLTRQTGEYLSALHLAGVEDEAMVNPHRASRWWAVFFVLTFPLFIFGYTFSYPVRWMALRVATTKVKKREFYSSVFLAVGYISGMIWYPLLIAAAFAAHRPFWIAVSLLLPLLGWWAIYYRELWDQWNAALKALRHPQREQLRAMRQDLKDQLAHCAAEGDRSVMEPA